MKLLMHMCCAPCALYPIEVSQNEKLDITGLFYNPNIHPLEEHTKRMEQVKIITGLFNIPVFYDEEFLLDKWLSIGETAERCKFCYDIRLEYTAKYAKENSFDMFTTSLLVSPYQRHDYIKNKCEELSKKYGVDFFYSNFREGYRKGQAKAKEIGIYRQKYCGCIFSKNN